MESIKKVKTAIVGCGNISNVYLVNLKNLFSIIDLVALCDLRMEVAEKACQTFGVEKALTLEQVLQDPEIELVINLTGPAAHYSVIKQCLMAQKHVYTEKMLCFDMEQGRELLELADKNHLYLGVAPDTFLGAGLQTARKALDCGLIGEVTSVTARINRNQLLNSEIFGFIRGVGGGLPYDVGIYYLTALLSLIGPVRSVSGFTQKPDVYNASLYHYGNYGKTWGFMSSNTMVAVLQFENGVLGTLHFDGSSINEEQPELVLYGTEGILRLGDPNTFNGPVELIRNNGESCVLPMMFGYSGSPQYGDPTNGSVAIHGHRGIGAAELAWALRRGRKPRTGKEMAFHALEIFCGVEKACQTGSTYIMNSTFERPAPLASGYMNIGFGGLLRLDAEKSLVE